MSDDRPICIGIPATGLWSPDIGREVAAFMTEGNLRIQARLREQEAKHQRWLDNTPTGRDFSYESHLKEARAASSPQRENETLKQIGWNPENFFKKPEPELEIKIEGNVPIAPPPTPGQGVTTLTVSKPAPAQVHTIPINKANPDLESMTLDQLRRYATNTLKMVGASKIPGGKSALTQRIRDLK